MNGETKMKRFPLSMMGFKLYIQTFLTDLIFGLFFRKENNLDDLDKCDVCGKSLKKRRFELSVTRPLFEYNFEMCKFLCVNHAIEILLDYKARENKENSIE